MSYFKQSRANLFVTNALIAINVMIIASGGFMTPLWSNFVLKIGGDLQTAGIAVSIFSVVIGVFMCIAGWIEHRYQNDEWFMCFSQLIVFGSYTAYLFVQHPWQLYLVQVGLGIGGAFQTPVICAIYQRYFSQKESTLFWAIWNGFFNIALGAGALVSSLLVAHFNYQIMFKSLSALAGICLLANIALMMHIRKVGLLEILSLRAPRS
jgi:predicted MFS family arabinose efflux permease